MKWGAGVALELGLCLACSSPEPPNPCTLDALLCRAPDGFELAPECDLEGELELELGQGRERFVSLAEGAPLELQRGPQGGQHAFLALRFSANEPVPASFQVSFRLESEDPGSGWTLVARRSIVVRARDLSAGPRGPELAGLLFLLPETVPDQRTARLVLEARDSCDRRARVEHAFQWA